MTKRLCLALSSMVALAHVLSCSSPTSPVDRDGGERDAPSNPRADAPLNDAPDEAKDASPSLDAPLDQWPRRECTKILRYRGRAGQRVEIAGNFSAWMPRAMRDDDGDGVYQIELGESDGIRQGQVYTYKFIVDGEWIFDPDGDMRRYDGACLNSAFRAPSCDAGPEIVVIEPLRVHFDPATRQGRATTRIEVRLARDGARLDALTAKLDGTQSITPTAQGSGQFTIRVDGLSIGKHRIELRASDERGRQSEPVFLPFWVEEKPFDWRDAIMYMIVVDRFANGDRSNDRPIGPPVERPADFHGGDLQGITQVIRSGYFESIGINTIWLSPINQQAEGHFPGRDDGRAYAGYHGYWPSRARDVEPRFGGNNALKELVQEAHRHGIRILFDLINNQVHEQHEYFRMHPGWFRTGCVCGIDPGCGWSERPLDCLFARYLPDINWRVPEAEEQFIADAVYWVEAFDIDGFRIDAVKHVETSSIYNLRAALSRRFEQGGARLYLVGETAVGQWDRADYGCGEVFPDGYAWLDAYVGKYALDGQFDFPSHHRMQHGLVRDEMPYTDLEPIVRDMELRFKPGGLHVRFLGTHDSNRIATRAARSPNAHCRWPGPHPCNTMPTPPTDVDILARIKRAFAALYSMPGIPFLYYGDEIAMAGGDDPDNRRDMVWTGALSHLAMGETSLPPQREELRHFIGALGRARLASVAMRRGRRVPLLVEPDLYVVTWTEERTGDLAIVAINRGRSAVENRLIDGLTPTVRGRANRLEAVAGAGSAGIEGTRLRLWVPMGGAVVFLGRE
ncbi:MAG: alpha-amylase family glycosyl hydrolase [Sandaracinaceae bacterium]|nr:alpha-amylase family glycosyl hydrolase [Sandaracinaceae bacterium]MDW8245714.1 alpha-amylase family glycosyl hydrolase [Sandaracinaceae bacterium]